MLAIIDLHYGICPNGLPRGLYKITPHQSVGAHRDPRTFLVVPTLVDAWCQANIASQMFYAVKAPQIPKLADDSAGHDPTYSRNTS